MLALEFRINYRYIKMNISGWGRYPVCDAVVRSPRTMQELRDILASSPNVIARGNGRSYGDSAINCAMTIDMRQLNRMLSFNERTGQLVVESGVILGEIISSFLPRGWFPIVTPGTKLVTVGGAIAADVHGKSHHKDGSFRACVDWVDVVDSSGQIQRCSMTENSELFDCTLGGMGLTGVVVRAAIRLRPVESGWIRQVTIPAKNLEVAIHTFEESGDATYSVAWIDCLGGGANLGRSLVMLGEHASLNELPVNLRSNPLEVPEKSKVSVPFDLPTITLNKYTVRLFNALYYRLGAIHSEPRLVDWDTFFYPLDKISHWNRIYGRKGFLQFQCVLPLETSLKGLTSMLKEVSNARAGSFLAVLKRFGPQQSSFSFPMAGYTLALDFRLNKKNLSLVDRLDEITIDFGGRFYLAKDSRMKADTLMNSDNRAAKFEAIRRSIGAKQKFNSSQSNRLEI